MKRLALAAALGCLPLAGCSVMQESYDARADAECDALPNTEERLACKRAAQDAEIKRRSDGRAAAFERDDFLNGRYADTRQTYREDENNLQNADYADVSIWPDAGPPADDAE